MIDAWGLSSFRRRSFLLFDGVRKASCQLQRIPSSPFGSSFEMASCCRLQNPSGQEPIRDAKNPDFKHEDCATLHLRCPKYPIVVTHHYSSHNDE